MFENSSRNKPLKAVGLLLTVGLALSLGGMAANANATPGASPAPVSLGAADSYSVLAATTVTNTASPTVISGDLGVSPGTSITGFPPGKVINGTLHSADSATAAAQASALAAYNDAAGRTPTQYVGRELGGLTLSSGVYSGGALEITGTLTLDGDENSVFIFQAASTIVTASYSNVVFTGGAKAANVFWKVGSSMTLGTYTNFSGNVLAHTSITTTTGVTVTGRLFALHAAVTLDNNKVNKPPMPAASTPPAAEEPADEEPADEAETEPTCRG